MTENQIASLRIEGEEVERIEETHISYVLLTKRHAYKIKKSVQFSFLDFSSLEKRKYYCERELQLNRRLTKGIYLAIIPIRKDQDQFVLGSMNGEIVDFALQMKRMQSDRLMHLLLEHSEISKIHISSIAKMVADFHRQTPILMRSFDPKNIRELFNDILSVDKILIGIDQRFHFLLKDLVAFSNAFIERYYSIFVDRVERGMIRDCHGDLHSRNIFLEEKPIIFDCIEFSDDFRAIDIVDEIAFFCMDLEVENRADLSQFFVEEYLSIFPNAMMYEADRMLFHYYKLYRANVRMKVMALQLNAANDSRTERTMEEVKKYLGLLERYLQTLVHLCFPTEWKTLH